MKKDLILLSDLSRDQIIELYEKTRSLKEKRQNGISHETLKGKTLGLIFSKQSTRTRISFEVGMFELGGYSLFLTEDQLQLKRGETLADSARVLSRYLSGIVIRTYDHGDVELLAKYAEVPVINGLTDLSHPVQILTDMYTIQEKLGKIEGVKVAYVGDGNNVAYSWILGASIMGMHLAIASPPQFTPPTPETMGKRGLIEMLEDPFEAVKDADIVYTDVWFSMGENKKNEGKIQDLQKYQINRELLTVAKKNALVMHPGPMNRGVEIDSKVADDVTRSLIQSQVSMGVAIRMACLKILIDNKDIN